MRDLSVPHINGLAKIARRLKTTIRRHFARHHSSAMARVLTRFSETYLMDYWNRSNFDFGRNGERFLIDVIRNSSDGEVVCFDVGANRGDYLEQLLASSPRWTVHCFEPIRPTFATLERKHRHSTGVTLNCIGLSSAGKAFTVYHFPDVDGADSSMPLSTGGAIKMECEAQTGDSYMEAHQIARIDLLKIDTEGHELEVLKGFGAAIRQGQVGVIQFEYGITALPARWYLGDVYRLLGPLGYRIGRLFPDGVEFKVYYPALDEGHIMGNWVAVHESNAALIEKLALQKYSIFQHGERAY